ncbi:hypothetical protein [Bosea sp. (in: a-proteobacteria)]|uniref:hypothetical protein n=1 Tax=Bosea sp. (in: a-proteobacteria) TaxID=1871050 RepID=UPI0026030E80|nr:hypothetical protein [Bosea sp. (in: a-proteobacteria)]MCO5092664.1 hypothetical protein [Bosea sp. (in: a-proteobacteria)]
MAEELSDIDHLTARIAALELLMTTALAGHIGREEDPVAAAQAMREGVMASGQMLQRGFSPKDDAVWAVVVQCLEQRLRELLARAQRESRR